MEKNFTRFSRLLLLLFFLTAFDAVRAATITVTSLAALQTAINNAAPGDIILLADGVYTSSADITVSKKGTAALPITIAAETIGGAEITGTGGFSIVSPAAYVIIKGFKFTHAASHAKMGSGTSFCRWTRNIFETPGEGEYLLLNGNDHEVDYNTFQNKQNLGRFIAVRGSGSQIAQRLWIHHNYFFKQLPGGGNGAETLQFGLSGYSLSSSNSIIEYNLFEECDGENELISVKASAVTIRYNTIRNCPAQFTLRHGNRSIVYGNYFINTPGLRIFGDDHVIFSNHFENCSIALNIGNGDGEVADGAPLTSHDRPDRVLIAFNTLVNNASNFKQDGRTDGLGATYITVANNIVQGGGAAASIAGPYTNPLWEGNIIFNTNGAGAMPATGYIIIDPKIAKDATGSYHLLAGSPAIDAATGSYTAVTTDMDGQPRVAPLDVGADEVSGAPVIARLLNPADVGVGANPDAVPDSSIHLSITSPANGTSFTAPAAITINATASDDSSTITKLEFFNGTIKIGEDSAAPYSFSWVNVAAGNYAVQVKATDSRGKINLSAPVSIVVNPAQGSSFDITDNGGTITAQYPNTSKPGENFPSLIDNNKSTKYYRSGRTALWVQYQSTAPAIVVSYTITSANDVPNRDPRDWNLQGSNDGIGWTTLDTQSGQTFASRLLTRSYVFTNTTSYVYYRLNITANNGETGTQFAEWELFERRLQTIAFDSIPSPTFGDDPFQLSAVSSAGLPVGFAVISGPATVDSSGFLAITGAGSVTVRASQAGSDKYFPASADQTFTVNKAPQDVHFETIGDKTYGDAPFALTASVDTHLPLVFTIVSGPATLSDSILTITGAGDITVRVSQAGNDNYLPADEEQTFTVNKAAQAITFAALPPTNRKDSVALSATASSGLPVSFTVVSGPGVITGNTLSFIGEGDIVIAATQAGNENWSPADTVNQTVLVFADGRKKEEIKLVIFPNPTRGWFTALLVNKKEVVYTLTLYNSRGEVVSTAKTQKNCIVDQVNFNITQPRGYYYLYVSDGAQVIVRQILKY